jgi:hypothetical protein
MPVLLSKDSVQGLEKITKHLISLFMHRNLRLKRKKQKMEHEHSAKVGVTDILIMPIKAPIIIW